MGCSIFPFRCGSVRHEIIKFVGRSRWERSPKGGIILPRSKLRFEGKYTHSVNGQDEQVDYNLIPTEGLNHILGVALYSTSKINTWYVAPFSGNVTPGAGWTAANFASTATEITSTTDGFELARIDLELRSEGNVLGTSQSGGRSSLRLLRAARDGDIILDAREAAAQILEADPGFATHPVLAEAISRRLSESERDFLDKN